ncbi:MAG: TetR family transcriptional regulator [Actinomycetota bacterium]
MASDHVESPAYRGLTPDDLFDIVVRHGPHFDQSRQIGVVFHMMSALPEHGWIGLTAIGESHQQADELYARTVAALDEEAHAATTRGYNSRVGMNLRTERKRVTKPPDERRQELMDAAVPILAEKGIPKTTVADITDAAGVAKGTFYLYYASKEHLLGAIKERLVDDILVHATALYDRVGREDWWALADATVESVVDFVLARRDMIHIIVQEGRTPETTDIFREARPEWTSCTPRPSGPG